MMAASEHQTPPANECERTAAAEPEQKQQQASAAPAADTTTTPEAVAATTADGLAELQSLQAELAAARDRELRAHAELENFRRRLYRQMDDERKYAILPLAGDLLGIVDNLDRAIRAAEAAGNGAGLLEGVRLVAQQLHRVLEQHHCQRIEAKGQPFDPSVHQAICQQPSDEVPAGIVLDEAQVGFQLHDRVIRPALVLVSSGPPAPAAEAGA
jgi:molecular chaperone GrpE